MSKSLRTLTVALSVGAALLLSSCFGGRGAGALYGPFAKVELVPKDYEIVERGVSAAACDFIIFGFSTGDSSFSSALKKLYAQITNPAHVLINMAIDHSFKFYLVAFETCTIVTADVAAVSGVGGGGAAAGGDEDGAGEDEDSPRGKKKKPAAGDDDDDDDDDK